MQKDKQFYDKFYNDNSVIVHNNPDRFGSVSSLLFGRVLDVACGTGDLSDYFLGYYVGVDFSGIAISRAREIKRKNATFKIADFAKDAFISDQKFDCAYLGEFLEHIEDDKIVFENLKDLLISGGRVVVTVPNGERVPDESHCRVFTVPQIRKEYSKYGKVTFHNWSGFKSRILFTIDLGVEPQNNLCLVMTVKDEEVGIENAIISALPYVDRVVVSVDTKSKDKTALIAECYADELKFHEWKDDFSKARNEAHENVKSKFILFLDGHEYIESVGNFRDLLFLPIDGILVTIKMENCTSFMYPRIYKNGLQFENAVHNALDCKIIKYCPDFVIVHDRPNLQSKDSARAREVQRDQMIPQIMADTLAKNPTDQRALFNLANWYMTKSDYKMAAKTYKKCLKFTPSPDEKYFVQAQLGIAHQMQDHQIRAHWYFIGLELIIPNRWETKRLLGGIKIQAGHYESALEFLVYAIDPNKQRYLYQLFGHDLAEIWDLIACCFFETNQFARAIIAWTEASSHTQDKNRKNFIATKIQLCTLLLSGENARATKEHLASLTSFN
jgi:SAM-dependent methyltransferase